jgi:hypothetical protein
VSQYRECADSSWLSAGQLINTFPRLGPMITTGFDEIEKTFNVTADEISFSLVGLLQLTTGSGTFFTAAAAAVWGKRPVFLISTFFLFGTSAWGFFAGVSDISHSRIPELTSITELPLPNLDESRSRILRRAPRNTRQRYRLRNLLRPRKRQDALNLESLRHGRRETRVRPLPIPLPYAANQDQDNSSPAS